VLHIPLPLEKEKEKGGKPNRIHLVRPFFCIRPKKGEKEGGEGKGTALDQRERKKGRERPIRRSTRLPQIQEKRGKEGEKKIGLLEQQAYSPKEKRRKKKKTALGFLGSCLRGKRKEGKKLRWTVSSRISSRGKK